MANPQKERGYTGIANEIIEAMAHIGGFTNSMHRITLAILRKTYGWKKKKDAISISQLQEITSLSKRTVIYALQQLEAKRIISVIRVKKGQYNQTNEISFNKDYDSWEIKKCAPQVERTRKNSLKNYHKKGSAKVKMDTNSSAKVSKKVVQKPVKGSANGLHIQKKIQNDIQKKDIKKYEYFLNGKQIGELIDAFKGVNPMYSDFFQRNIERQAVDHLARRLTFEKTLSIILQLPTLTAMPFAPKISSPTQLRRKLGEMVIFYNQEMAKKSSIKKEDREIIL